MQYASWEGLKGHVVFTDSECLIYLFILSMKSHKWEVANQFMQKEQLCFWENLIYIYIYISAFVFWVNDSMVFLIHVCVCVCVLYS